MINTRLFNGEEHKLIVYNGQAIISMSFRFYTYDECTDLETEFDFPDFSSAYLRVYNERLGRDIKDIQLTRSGSSLVANISIEDMTFDVNGDYYYEIGYVMSVYDQVLRYGRLTVI